MKTKFPFLLLLTIIFLIPFQNKGFASGVSSINWSSIHGQLPNDPDSERIKNILINTNKYGLTTWWNVTKNYDSQTSSYINFGGTAESHIRPPAAMALGLATSLAFDIYNPSITGVSEATAKERTVKLVSSLALRHKANMNGGWGDQWQSAHWAYFSGFSGWLLWNDLTTTEQNYIRNMVEYEANRFLNYTPLYWKTLDGYTLYPGDTKAEENAWNAQILQLASAMMPNHPNWNQWMNKNIELMLASSARSTDQYNQNYYNGKMIKDWINGSNINEDGTVINHGFIHPDYMEFIAFNATSAIQYTLAGMSTPKSAFFNSDLVYKGLVDLPFTAPLYHSPGGSIYQENSSDIYYPQGNDWGTHRRMQFATLDIFASTFKFDTLASKKGSYWEPYHAEMVLNMQNRFHDRRTYGQTYEDTYSGREEWVAHHASWAWMSKWIHQSGNLVITNEFYGPTTKRLAGIDRYETAINISKEGWPTANTVFITRGDSFPDALAGVPLAYQNDSPILLTSKNYLPENVKNEIIRLKAKKAIILGGNSAVDRNVEYSIKKIGLQVERIAGTDRFDTASMIAQKMERKETQIIAYGYNFPDAMSAATMAAKKGFPILLVDSKKIPPQTQSTLNVAKKVYVVGGTNVVDSSLLKYFPNPTRISGTDRFETSVNLLKTFNLQSNKLSIANGYTFPDALTGAVLSAKQEANLLLVPKDHLPTLTSIYLESYPLQHLNILGGNAVIDDHLTKLLLQN